MKSKVVVVQNIITAYRIELFNELKKQLCNRGHDFEVLYYRKAYPGRYLPFSLDKINFKYHLGKGFFAKLRGFKVHLNLCLVFSLIFLQKKDKVIVGVSWNDVNVILILLLKRLRLIKAEVLLWSEANYLTKGARQKGKLKVGFRDFIFNLFNFRVIVPGQMAKNTICEEWGYSKEIFFLPNLINGNLYKVENRPELIDKIRLLTIARLDEADKGIINFIGLAGRELISKFEWNIAGDGPDRKRLELLISEVGLEGNINLLGNRPSEEVKRLYAQSDVFLLPSLSDPNPLTVIEALHSGLALLISNRCGNVVEAVKVGENGFSFDPIDQESVQLAMNMILKRKAEIPIMSSRSCVLAAEEFDLVNSIEKFVEKLYFVDAK